MVSIIKFLAVDASGDFFIYNEKPKRDNKDKSWMGDGASCVGFKYSSTSGLSDLDDIPEEYRSMTWDDEPVAVELVSTLRPFTP